MAFFPGLARRGSDNSSVSGLSSNGPTLRHHCLQVKFFQTIQVVAGISMYLEQFSEIFHSLKDRPKNIGDQMKEKLRAREMRA